MNLHHLRYARALAETLSFNAAADRCHVTQPTLSNAIAQLEAELGAALFARTTRSVRLTEFGLDLLPSVLDVLNAQNALVTRARHLVQPDRPVIRIGVSPLIEPRLIAALCEPFQRDNPMVELVFREMNLAEMIRMVADGHLDFLIGPLEGDLPSGPKWRSVVLYAEPLIYLHKGVQGGSHGPVVLADVAASTFVLVPETCGLSMATRSLFARNGQTLREYSGQALSYRVLQEWAAIGIGAAILPRSKVQAGTGAPIVVTAGQTEAVTIRYHALWCPKPEQGPELGRLATYLGNVGPAILAGIV